MANLGGIEVEAPRDNQQGVDRANAGVVRGLQQLGGLIEQKVEDDVLGDARDQFLKRIAGADKSSQGGLDIVPVEPTDSPQADALLKKIRTFEAIIAGGSSNLVGRAKLGLKQTLNELQREHPSFAGQIQTLHNSFVSGNETLAALGITDSRINSGGADELASRRLRELEDRGYASVSDDGMAIPRSVLPDSPQFARLYIMGQGVQQARQAGLLRQMVRRNAGTSNIDTPGTVAFYQEEMMGRASHLQQSIMDFADENLAVLNELQKDRDVQDSDFVFAWVQGGGKEAALERISNTEVAYATYLDTIPLNQRGTEQFKQLVEIRDSQIEHLRNLKTAITTGSTDIMDAWRIQNAMRMMDIRNSNPKFDTMLLFGELLKAAYGDKMFQTLTGQEAILQDTMGRSFINATEETWAAIWAAGGKGNIDPDATPEQRREDLASTRATTTAPFPNQGAVSEMDPKEIAEETLAKFAQLQNWADKPNGTPATGIAILDAYASDLDRLNAQKGQYLEVRDGVVDFLNSDSAFDIIKIMVDSGTRPATSALVNFVDTVMTQFNKGSADSGLGQVTTLLTGSGSKYNLDPLVAIGSLVDYDFSQFAETGKVSVTLNPQRIAAQGARRGIITQNILRDVREAMTEWSQEVRALALLDYARGATATLDYRKTAEDNLMFSVFHSDWLPDDE